MAGCCYSCSVETSHCSRTSLFCFCFCCVCAFFRGFLVVFFLYFHSTESIYCYAYTGSSKRTHISYNQLNEFTQQQHSFTYTHTCCGPERELSWAQLGLALHIHYGIAWLFLRFSFTFHFVNVIEFAFVLLCVRLYSSLAWLVFFLFNPRCIHVFLSFAVFFFLFSFFFILFIWPFVVLLFI